MGLFAVQWCLLIIIQSLLLPSLICTHHVWQPCSVHTELTGPEALRWTVWASWTDDMPNIFHFLKVSEITYTKCNCCLFFFDYPWVALHNKLVIFICLGWMVKAGTLGIPSHPRLDRDVHLDCSHAFPWDIYVCPGNKVRRLRVLFAVGVPRKEKQRY